MPETVETTTTNAENSAPVFDYAYVNSTARVALYDDLKAAPRVTDVGPAPTNEFIERLAATIDDQAKRLGGRIPYTAIREVSENFIHAQFRDMVVSILDGGNTIRFADRGPGIPEKENAQKPGFTSAVEPMKRYIRGVGSGLPIVREWMTASDGSIVIEDNLTSGAVVTISLVSKPAPAPATTGMDAAHPIPLPHIPLSEREQMFLKFLLSEGELGVTEIHELTNIPNGTIHNTFSKLEQAALIEKTPNRKRSLTDIGLQLAQSL